MISAIILAAGYSSRMGSLKALLPFAGTMLLKKQIAVMKDAGIGDITVVSGHKAESICSQIGSEAKVVYNPDYDRGMYTSIQAGVELLGAECEGFLFMPVDYALVRPYMIKLLTQKFMKDTGRLLFPSYNGRRGHPPILPGFMAQELLSYGGEGGARRLFQQFSNISSNYEFPTDECLVDMDTPEDYKRAVAAYARTVPSEAECMAMLKAENTPEHIIAHCITTARVALKIAEAVEAKGANIDNELVYSAALLHDINKVQPQHDIAGAQTLLSNGFGRVASIIRNHMKLDKAFIGRVCEETVVYLADKIIKGTEIMPLDERLEKTVPEKREFAVEKLSVAAAIQKQVELLCGDSIYGIIRKGNDR